MFLDAMPPVSVNACHLIFMLKRSYILGPMVYTVPSECVHIFPHKCIMKRLYLLVVRVPPCKKNTLSINIPRFVCVMYELRTHLSNLYVTAVKHLTVTGSSLELPRESPVTVASLVAYLCVQLPFITMK